MSESICIYVSSSSHTDGTDFFDTHSPSVPINHCS